MAKGEIITGLDIGSNQIHCVAGRRSDDSDVLEILGGARIACRGVKGGVVINLRETSIAIEKIISLLEEQIDDTIKQVYVGLRGNHIESMNERGAINISRTDKEITSEDVAGALENAKTIRISSDREILHAIPQEYSLNHQRGVPNPVGMEGNFLEVDVHILTASSSHLSNIFKAVEQAGMGILDPIHGLMALGDVVITSEEKELGCILIDFGGLTTGIAIYTEGSIRYSKELQIGFDFITRDISHSLRTSLSTAQDIKEKYGISMGSLLKNDSKFDYTMVDGRTIRTATRRQLVEIIQPRLDQIFVAIDDELKKSNLLDEIGPGGIIISGGGSKLEGIVSAADQALSSQTRIGLPQDVTGPDEIVLNTSYATAIGLLRCNLLNSSDNDVRRHGKTNSLINTVKGWFSDNF